MAGGGRSRLLPAVVGGLVLVLALGYWRFHDYFAPPVSERLPLDDCDLNRQVCRRSLPGGGELEFGITPRPIPLVSPLTLEVRVRGVEPEKVEVDFSGVTMNMGYNRPVLERVEKGLYRGEGFLPVCIRQRMDWEARVLLHLPGRVLAVPWRFDTIRD